MLEVKINVDGEPSYIKIKSNQELISKELFALFDALEDNIGAQFKSAICAYLECNEELAEAFINYHNSDTAKFVNKFINSILEDQD